MDETQLPFQKAANGSWMFLYVQLCAIVSQVRKAWCRYWFAVTRFAIFFEILMKFGEPFAETFWKPDRERFAMVVGIFDLNPAPRPVGNQM